MGNGQIRRHDVDANLAGGINEILCCFGGNTDKWYICSKPILMAKFIRIFVYRNV